MSPQLSLTYSPSYVGGKIWEQRLEILRSAVNHLGLKEVSFALDVSGSMVSDALNERDRKRWAGEWIDVVKQMLLARPADEIARKIYQTLVEIDLTGSDLVIRSEDFISPEDEATFERVRSIRERKARAR